MNIPGRPDCSVLILARTVRWAHQFARAMGWDSAEVRVVTDKMQIQSAGHRTIIFELAGWTSHIPGQEKVNEIANELMFAKRRGAQVVYLEAEKLV